MKKIRTDAISIGDVALRTGLSVSAIRFYEEKGLVAAGRNSGGQRRFARSDIRRLSFVIVAQNLGFSLERIRRALSAVPLHKAPTKRDWQLLAQDFRVELDDRIAALERMRDRLDGCIGCGCLSLDVCALYNPDDEIGERGSGPRRLLED